jgi:hypothetical protein
MSLPFDFEKNGMVRAWHGRGMVCVNPPLVGITEDSISGVDRQAGHEADHYLRLVSQITNS